MFTIRVPKVPFRFFDKLKNEIQNSILRFCFSFNKEDEIQKTVPFFCLIDSFFQFLLLHSFFIFIKKWKTKYILFFVFHFNEEIEKRIT